MDPLSSTASILAILGAGGAIAKALKNIGRLKEAPCILLQLNNEVTDLHLLIRGVDELYHQHSDSTRMSQRQIVCSILNRAKEALLELEELISYRWTKETDNGVKIDRAVWIRAQKKVQEMKDKIRSVKHDLNGAWMVISAKDESQQILVSIGHLLEGHSENHGLLNQSITFLSNQEQSLEVLRQRAHQNVNSLTPLPIGRRRNSTDPSSIMPHPAVDTTSSSSPLASPLLPAGCSTIFHIQLAKYHRCRPTCACSCHRKSFHKTPHFFKSVLGSLFVGYVGFPTSHKPCNTSICQAYLRKELQFLYIFPSWLLSWAVSTTMAFTTTRGPELILRCLRVRSNESQIFQSILRQDSVHTMNLIATGKGSVLDINENGNSIILLVLRIIWRRQMRLQSNSYHFELLRNLISEGADVFLENDLMESPYTYAWRYRLTKSAPEIGLEVIDELLGTADPVEMMGFNDLHSSIAGPRASHVAFETQLQQTSRGMVNARDKVGRTVLSWAGELGSLEIIEKLLHKGADPNIADNLGFTPLFYCGPRIELLRSLLRAGANANHMSRYGGLTTLELLVQWTDNPGLMEELWKFGANIHHRERGQDWTLLHTAIAYKKPQIVRWVLQKGADIEALTKNGANSLLTAIWAGIDAVVIEWLLEMSADYKLLDERKEGVLHYIARSGSLQAMSVLQRAGLSDLNLRQKSTLGYNSLQPCSGSVTAMDIAEQRRKNNAEWAIDNLKPPDPDPEAWFTAFQTFFDSIRAADVAERFGDFWGSLDEAGPVQRVAEHTDTDLDYLPGLPGAYINE